MSRLPPSLLNLQSGHRPPRGWPLPPPYLPPSPPIAPLLIARARPSGILSTAQSDISFGARILLVLQQEVPEFLWEFNTLEAEDYGLAQHRTRVVLRGLRANASPMPAPLPAMPRRRIEDCARQILDVSRFPTSHQTIQQ